MASGSEVQLALAAHERLAAELQPFGVHHEVEVGALDVAVGERTRQPALDDLAGSADLGGRQRALLRIVVEPELHLLTQHPDADRGM